MTTQPPEGPRVRIVWWLLIGGGALALVYLLRGILSPFLFAAILAYICNPLVGRLQQRRVPRTLGTLLVMLLLGCAFVLLALIMLPMLQREIGMLSRGMPGFLAALNERWLPWLQQHFGVTLQLDLASLKETLSEHLSSAQNVAGQLFASLKIGGIAVLGFLVNALLVPVVLFYLLRDWPRLLAAIDSVIPRRWHARVLHLARDTDEVLGQFLRGQLSVMVLMSVYYSVALWIAGLEYPLPVGIITGMLVFVPYVGMITGLVLGTLSGLVQFQAIGPLIPVWIAFGVGQALEGMVVTPWLVGDRVGLHPVAVIFALLAFGQVFGFVGVLLALPASAALLVLLRHVGRHYLGSRMFTD